MSRVQPSRKSESSLWLGCDARAWFGLLARHGFAVDRSRWHVAALVSALSPFQTAMGLLQQAVYGGEVARTPIRHAPLFVLGHWRSGTTLLHELLACDPRHAFPTTYECFAPQHALLTASWLPGLLRWLSPSRRPMDNMAAGYERPQEDEFALFLLGQPSPYERIAFPNEPPDPRTLDLRGLPTRVIHQWEATFRRLMRQWTLAKGGRRLVLKSPPHSCRIPTLLKLFPDARFVHIVRDPYVVYPSTLHLWRVLYTTQGLQRPAWQDLQEYILQTFVHLYDRLEEGKLQVPPGRFHELRYEDLIADPVGRVKATYRALDLGDFEPARPHVERHVAGLKGYETNRYVLTADERTVIAERWGEVIRRYGYDTSIARQLG